MPPAWSTRERDGTRVRYALAGDDVLRLWLALATPLRRGSPRSSARRATTSATTSRRSAATSCSSGFAGDVVLVDVRPAEEFDAGHIDGARLDPARRARRSASPSCPPTRDRRLLPRPVLRIRPRGGPPACAPQGAPPGGSRTAGPNGSSPSRARRDTDRRRTRNEHGAAQDARHTGARAARQAHVRGGRARARRGVPLRDRPRARRRLGYPPEDLDRIPRPRSTRSRASATSSTWRRSSRARRSSTSAAARHGQLPRRRRGRAARRVVGVDMTDEQLAKARRLAADAGFDNVEFRAGLYRGAAGRRARLRLRDLERRDQPVAGQACRFRRGRARTAAGRTARARGHRLRRRSCPRA